MDNYQEDQTTALREAEEANRTSQPVVTKPMRDLPDFNVPVYMAQDYDGMKVHQLAAHLSSLKVLKDAVKALHTTIQGEYDHLSINVLPERMEDDEIETLKVKNVGRLQSRPDIYCSVPSANREAVQEWLISQGFGSMVEPTVNSSTLKAFIKDCIAGGKPYPADLIKVTPYVRANVVKA